MAADSVPMRGRITQSHTLVADTILLERTPAGLTDLTPKEVLTKNSFSVQRSLLAG